MMLMKKKFTTMLVVLLGMAFLVDGLSLNNLEDDKRMDVSKNDVRAEKRAFLQFGTMITCATGRWATDYLRYGNWCGTGINAGTPVDGVDRCCKAHDLCYRRHLSCRPKWNVYNYATSGSHPSCTITCSSGNDQCGMDVCNCDKVAAECFGGNTYNSANNRG